MKPISKDDRQVANIHEAVFAPFVYPDGLALGRDGDHAPQTTLVCFDDRSQALMSPAST